MIVALLLIALIQDGPVRTAPTADPAPQTGEAPGADPGPACNVGGRPVSRPGCPPPPDRLTFDVAPGPQTGEPATGAEGAAPPSAPSDESCDSANRPSGRAGFDCALRLARAARAAERVRRSGLRTAEGPGGDVPDWALSDPGAWEASQCGSGSDDACRRQARNRLAMARAGVATDVPPASGRAAASQDCRTVMRRSEDGFGGSVSRVCGDTAESETALDRLRETTRSVGEPCDRPAALETQDAWIARCQALPAR